MELSFDKKKNLEERIGFVRYYAAWVRKVPNGVWSRQQAALIDSFMENCKNFGMSREKYLEMMEKKKQKHPRSP